MCVCEAAGDSGDEVWESSLGLLEALDVFTQCPDDVPRLREVITGPDSH